MTLPRSVREADVAGKHVLVRADLNVPLEVGEIADDTRIQAALPTLRWLLDHGAASVRVCSHLGRPKGADATFRIAPVAARLHELLPDGRIVVLENTRFDPGETRNDDGYARTLADGADLYVNDGMHYMTRRPDEILTAIHIPDTTGWRSTYWKLRRRGSFDFPVLGVAAAVRLARDGTVEDARLVLGAVAGMKPSQLCV